MSENKLPGGSVHYLLLNDDLGSDGILILFNHGNQFGARQVQSFKICMRKLLPGGKQVLVF